VQPEPLIATTPVPEAQLQCQAQDEPMSVPPAAISVPANHRFTESQPPPAPPVALETVAEASTISTATPELTTTGRIVLPPTESSKKLMQQRTGKACTSNKCNRCFATRSTVISSEVKRPVPPDVDASGFPIQGNYVSRIHADVEVEAVTTILKVSVLMAPINNLPLLLVIDAAERAIA